jgi:hypothetical protein
MRGDTRPTQLHFYAPEHVTNFGAIARAQNVKYEVREEKEETGVSYYVKTEPLTATNRSKLITAWGKASTEVLYG